MSQVDLARRIGVTKQAVSNWEHSDILPAIDTLKKIATLFSVSIDFLLEIDDKCYVNVEGLSIEEVTHIQQMVNDIKKLKNVGV